MEPEEDPCGAAVREVFEEVGKTLVAPVVGSHTCCVSASGPERLRVQRTARPVLLLAFSINTRAESDPLEEIPAWVSVAFSVVSVLKLAPG